MHSTFVDLHRIFFEIFEIQIKLEFENCTVEKFIMQIKLYYDARLASKYVRYRECQKAGETSVSKGAQPL